MNVFNRGFLLGLLFVTALAWLVEAHADERSEVAVRRPSIIINKCRTAQDLQRGWMWIGDYAVACAVTRVVIHEQDSITSK